MDSRKGARVAKVLEIFLQNDHNNARPYKKHEHSPFTTHYSRYHHLLLAPPPPELPPPQLPPLLPEKLLLPDELLVEVECTSLGME